MLGRFGKWLAESNFFGSLAKKYGTKGTLANIEAAAKARAQMRAEQERMLAARNRTPGAFGWSIRRPYRGGKLARRCSRAYKAPRRLVDKVSGVRFSEGLYARLRVRGV